MIYSSHDVSEEWTLLSVSETHLNLLFFPPYVSLLALVTLSPVFSTEFANIVQHLSRRQMWDQSGLFSFWLAPCGVGFATIPFLPSSSFDVRHVLQLTQHEIYQRAQLLKSVAQKSQHLKGDTKHHSFVFPHVLSYVG